MRRQNADLSKRKCSILVCWKGKAVTFVPGKDRIKIGHSSNLTDLVIDSPIVSSVHGEFFTENNAWYYRDLDSTNGTFINGEHIWCEEPQSKPEMPRRLRSGTVIRIDKDPNRETKLHRNGVLIYFVYGDIAETHGRIDVEVNRSWKKTIGRSEECGIRLDTETVAKVQGSFEFGHDGLHFTPSASSVKTFINGRKVSGRTLVEPRDILVMGSVKLICLGSTLIYSKPSRANDIYVRNLSFDVWTREDGGRFNFKKKRKRILNGVSCDIFGGELVAVLGGSGAGKTTFTECLMGVNKPAAGTIYIGNDKLEFGNRITANIGYVPQDSNSTMRGDLTVGQTLKYAAKLSLSPDTSDSEIDSLARMRLNQLELDPDQVMNKKVRSLSGGQRTRVSIAQELIRESSIIFLDEPTSGQDPHTESEMVSLMRRCAHDDGRTMIVVTHTVMSIDQFDRLLFFGCGQLCYAGVSIEDARNFFGVKSVKKIFDVTSSRRSAKYYADKYMREFGRL